MKLKQLVLIFYLVRMCCQNVAVQEKTICHTAEKKKIEEELGSANQMIYISLVL